MRTPTPSAEMSLFFTMRCTLVGTKREYDTLELEYAYLVSGPALAVTAGTFHRASV